MNQDAMKPEPHKEVDRAREEVARLRELSTEEPEKLPELAAALDKLGMAHSRAARPGEAEQATREAIAILRDLDPSSTEHRELLALCLYRLGRGLLDLERPEEARAASEEAVAKLRELMDSESGNGLRYSLACGLGQLALCLNAIHRHEEALEADKVALEHLEQLPGTERERRGLASSLHNMGTCFMDLGQHEEALSHAQRALELYRELCSLDPQAHRLELAHCVTLVGQHLGNLGRWEEAADAKEEALVTYRALAEQSPGTFLPVVASTLGQLGYAYAALGDEDEALGSFLEAAAHYRKCAAFDPERFLPKLEDALRSSILRTTEYEDELPLRVECVAVLRTLVERDPETYLPDLADCLEDLSRILCILDRQAEAEALAREAVELWRKLGDDAAGLARSSSMLFSVLSDLDREEEAIPVGWETVELLRELAKEDPEEHLDDLSVDLGTLAFLIEERGDQDQARDLYAEALEAALTVVENQLPDEDFADLAPDNARYTAGDYLAACKATDTPGNEALLRRYVDVMGEELPEPTPPDPTPQEPAEPN